MQSQKELKELGNRIASTMQLAEKLDQRMAAYLLSMASLEVSQTLESIQQRAAGQRMDN
ncbi:hypothetical protein [Bradyrhizobium sp. 2TAF24]|uniref:hypothetical protein n=1 Tax=Bradyrhizobium sp. 2TAF24 TaxID=3233011 RepID=UPI003F8E6673